VLFPVEDAHIDDLALFAVRQAQGRVLHLPRLFAEDGAQELLFRAKLLLTFGRDLADQDVVRPDLRTDADDAALIQVLERVFTHVGDVVGDLLRAELGIAGFDLVLLDVHAGEFVVADQRLADQQGVLVVAPFPAQESAQHVMAEGQIAIDGRGAIGDDRAGLDPLALAHDRPLVDAG